MSLRNALGDLALDATAQAINITLAGTTAAVNAVRDAVGTVKTAVDSVRSSVDDTHAAVVALPSSGLALDATVSGLSEYIDSVTEAVLALPQDVARDSTATDAISRLDSLLEQLLVLHRDIGNLPRVLPYAVDNTGSMRVNVMTGGLSQQSWFGNSSNLAPPIYQTGSPNAMDAREAQRELSFQTYQDRRSRWSIT